jgi:hypothetical protein
MLNLSTVSPHLNEENTSCQSEIKRQRIKYTRKKHRRAATGNCLATGSFKSIIPKSVNTNHGDESMIRDQILNGNDKRIYGPSVIT